MGGWAGLQCGLRPGLRGLGIVGALDGGDPGSAGAVVWLQAFLGHLGTSPPL